MSVSATSKQTKVLAALLGFAALVVSNYYFKPAASQTVALRMGRELDHFNGRPHPEQDRLDTILDRTQMLEEAKRKKPWNRTFSDRAEMH